MPAVKKTSEPHIPHTSFIIIYYNATSIVFHQVFCTDKKLTSKKSTFQTNLTVEKSHSDLNYSGKVNSLRFQGSV